jgi:Flp pilus assembly protein CpaB
MFRVSQFSNADPQTVAQWVTVATFKNTAEGKVTNSDVRAGFPVAKSQIDPSVSSQVETRLSLLLTDTNQYYFAVPVKPDEIGNFIQPGDRIDIILNLGGGNNSDSLAVEPPGAKNQNAGAGTSAGAQSEITLTTKMPVTKLVMQNLEIIRIERANPSSSANNANQQSQGQPQAQPTPVPMGSIQRMYIKVDRDQLEVLSFVMNNGKHDYAVRAANGSQESLPTDGVTWADFARWFYAQRGNKVDGAQPFDAISPSVQNTAGR